MAKMKYTMTNFSTGQTVHKIQKTEPRLKGFTCVNREKVMPLFNDDGDELFFDANNRPYYAHVLPDGSHYQP